MTTVLIVDDNPAILEIFEAILIARNYDTLTVSGGEDCLNILKTTTPDIILLDIMMEPVDGWETLMRIRACPDTKKVPVIMVTGKEATDEEKNTYCSYYTDYILKPVSARHLRETIEQALHAAAE